MGNFRNRGGQGGYGDQSGQYRNAFGGSGFNRGPPKGPRDKPAFVQRREKALQDDERMSVKPLAPGSDPRVGWLFNMAPTTVEEPGTKRPVQAVDLLFIAEDGGNEFSATVISRPYMLVAVPSHTAREVEMALRRDFRDQVAEVSTVRLEDTSQSNHLALEEKRMFLKVEARMAYDLREMSQKLLEVIARNADRRKRGAGVNPAQNMMERDEFEETRYAPADGLDYIEDIREYDVAPVNRFAIDNHVNVGYWYRVSPGGFEDDVQDFPESAMDDLAPGVDDPDVNAAAANSFTSAQLHKLPDIVDRANPVVLAYDIECTKAPLKFPDARAGDQVMMISWMVDGKGYLGINREVVSEDIEDFDYKPHDRYQGSFEVFNERNELALLERFFREVRLAAPRVFVTYNGDFFDWPFVEARASQLGLSMSDEIGMATNDGSDRTPQTQGRTAIHMDVFHWVNRDSYLPQGSRGLKAVTRALLGFEPEEIPPEEMMAAALERPMEMAKYSVSDAVCTYYLYMKYVHPFIFSLCNIIPLSPDDVLRKGSGTLCEMLLMCQAHDKRIVAPNKHSGSAIGKLTKDGHVLETETYVGGHVEALRTGVYRSDLPASFSIDVTALDDLESSLDETLKFAITVEGGLKMEDVENYDEIRQKIVESLNALRERPARDEKPLIYHLDVSAMYPNIILTNRLQPHAIVTDQQCASCDFMGTSNCQRNMEWTWRGEHFPASRGEAEMVQRLAAQDDREEELREIRRKREAEDEEGGNGRNGQRDTFSKTGAYGRSAFGGRSFGNDRNGGSRLASSGKADIPNFSNVEARQNEKFRKRLKDYCRTNYRRGLDTRVEERVTTICQRENPFYVDTVRAFRDRRYEYKALLKKQKRALAEAKDAGDKTKIADAERKIVLYDSLQLAHKCILNSFYGYVMRKGARWYSMEMAGVVTHTGALIIRRAKEFIDRVGLPLELDTDGIWCMLPTSFPENYTFRVKNGKPHTISYICSVFNADVAANFTNHQYQDLADPETLEYNIRSECSILFEVDGPYRAMVLPASLEEGKSIKKRYAVFNEDGSLAELKGFEIKRRGELKLIKEFQGEIFKQFLSGSSLKECYAIVGAVCNKWLGILTSRGKGMSDSEILDLLVEQNNMSKPLEEYVQLGQKSLAITCATRMRAFLGDAITANAGLATYYVVSAQPDEIQVTERAIPVQVFDLANKTLREKLLRKWTGGAESSVDLRALIDWNYYKGRFANAVLKIVSIPAALQAQNNPVPGIEYPKWLMKRCRDLQDKRKQKTVTSFFTTLPKGEKAQLAGLRPLIDAADDSALLPMADIEDMPLKKWTETKRAYRRNLAVVTRRKKEEVKSRRTGKSSAAALGFRSVAKDPDIREKETRDALKRLFDAERPKKSRDYAGWVQHAKKIWRAQRAARVQRYALKRAISCLDDDCSDKDGIDGDVILDAGSTARIRKRPRLVHDTLDYAPENFVKDMVQKKARKSFFTSTKQRVQLLGIGVLWQVVAIAPVPGAVGEFRMFVLPTIREGSTIRCGDIETVPLHVNRILHFSSRSEAAPDIPEAIVEEAPAAVLPRSSKQKGSFRVELPEERFRAKDKELCGALTDALSVDTVFGSKSPLDYEAVLDVGIVCVPRRGSFSGRGTLSTSRMLAKGLDMADVVPKEMDFAPYLMSSGKSESKPLLSQAFLFGSHAADGTSRATYVAVAPSAKQVLVVFVSSASVAVKVNMSSLWARVVAARREETGDEEDLSPDSALPRDVDFRVRHVRTRPGAWGELNSFFSRLRDGNVTSEVREAGRRMLVLAQWPSSSADLLTAPTAKSRASAAGIEAGMKILNPELCIPSLRSFPTVRISSNDADGRYQPVGWENSAATVAMTRFLDVSNWLSEHLALSRFSGIPVGNMSTTDVHSQALDVLVGRELRSREHVLWASEGVRPDLGGLEEEDNVASEEVIAAPEYSSPGSYRSICIDTELSDLAIATILSASHVNELEGTDLAFDAAANPSARGGDTTGKSGLLSSGGIPREGEIGGARCAPLDEMASSAPTFRVLKSLVASWEKTSVRNSADSDVAKGLLDHCQRWIGSESSLLYDPGLARFLAWLIRKMFWQLLSELKNLGAGIVYASSSRLIIATPKFNAIEALRYAGHLERTLKSKPLFQHVRFEPLLAINSSMIFVDRFNYGSLPAPEEDAVLSGEFAGDDNQVMVSNSRRVYGSGEIGPARMTWDIARYLPVPVGVLLSQIVEEFMRRPMVDRIRLEEELDKVEDDLRREEDEKQKVEEEAMRLCDEEAFRQAEEDEAAFREMEGMGTDGAPASVTKPDPPSGPTEVVEKNPIPAENGLPKSADTSGDKPVPIRRKRRPRGDAFEVEVRKFIQSVSGDLLQKVEEVREKTPLLEVPDVPTALDVSVHGPRNPALEFVRTMCHVLSLDRAATEDVMDLRRNLLRLLGVREFAKEARFVDPSLPLVLRNVICSFCNAVVDLDLARDARLWDPLKAAPTADGEPPQPWSCEYCAHPYDKSGIELSLIRDAQRLVVAYQVQDLQCKKCKLVKQDNMSLHCGCSGMRYDLSVNGRNFYQTIRALRSVAKFHSFVLLEQTLEWITDSCCQPV